MTLTLHSMALSCREIRYKSFRLLFHKYSNEYFLHMIHSRANSGIKSPPILLLIILIDLPEISGLNNADNNTCL